MRKQICTLSENSQYLKVYRFASEPFNIKILTGDVDLFTSDDNDLLSIEDELGNNGGKTSIHMGSAINNDGLGCEARHSSENVKYKL